MYKLVNGIVIKGKELGRTIGYRTANVKLDKVNSKGIECPLGDENLDLESGTYKVNGIINGKVYKGVGAFFAETYLFETHFFDFNQDIYGSVIEIMILYKIRENKKFNNLDELKDQIKKDVEFAKSNNDYVLTFGTFDITHPGHEYYLRNARLYGDKLVTIVATDENVYKFKLKFPKNNQEQRLENVKNLGISDIVIIGEGIKPLKWIDLYMPKVVCLGYDQKGFSDILENYLLEKNLDIKILRIDSFRDDIYKSSKIKIGKI